MAKCPFCGAELNHLVVYESVCTTHVYKVDSDGHWEWQYDNKNDRICRVFCPECDEEIPLHDCFADVDDFLREKYIVLRSDDSEIRRKGNFVLFRGKVYKVEEETDDGMLYLTLVKDELITDILKAELE